MLTRGVAKFGSGAAVGRGAIARLMDVRSCLICERRVEPGRPGPYCSRRCEDSADRLKRGLGTRRRQREREILRLEAMALQFSKFAALAESDSERQRLVRAADELAAKAVALREQLRS